MSFIKKVLSKKIKHVLWLIVAILLTLYAVIGREYRLIWNYGESMEPTIMHNDILITHKVGENWVPSRYDVVVIRDSETRGKINKRIIGLPSEKISYKDGYFYVNDKKLKNDHFGDHNVNLFIDDFTVPKNCIFVIGDNRDDSMYGIYMIKEVVSEVINL